MDPSAQTALGVCDSLLIFCPALVLLAVGVGAGVVIVPWRTSMLWVSLLRLRLRLARSDMLVSGAGLEVVRAVSRFEIDH